MRLLLYLLAVVYPSLALLLCRRRWQAAVSLVVTLVVLALAALHHEWAIPLGYGPVVLWALFAVDHRYRDRRATELIRAAWSDAPQHS